MKKDLTFPEFNQMCKDAGIASDETEMEQDYRNGMVMADLVDVLLDLVEAKPAKGTTIDDAMDIDIAVDYLDIKKPIAEQRSAALRLAALAVRFAADHCHDEPELS